jgi:ribosomal protein S18 acetylase RimI-like enzyme
VTGIELRDEHTVDLAALARLRARCDFKERTPELLQLQLDGARWIVHAYAGEQLVGFARAISDGVASAYLSSVMVDPDYQRRGIGRAMVERLLAGRDHIKWVLHSAPDAMAFYAALGFAVSPDLMLRDRK